MQKILTMNYIKLIVNIDNLSDAEVEIIIAELADSGFEGFEEDEDTLAAYIPEKDFNESKFSGFLATRSISGKSGYTIEVITPKNWNEEWEQSFHPVLVKNACYIRSSFHPPRPDVQHEIIINPKMSFGTGHHATTSLMIEAMLSLDFTQKTVLDMGCGTGILAILASKLGAAQVTAIDIDDNAIDNATENIELNNTKDITIIKGGADHMPKQKYDIVLANINRNILMQDLPAYIQHMKDGSELLVSGIMADDVDDISQLVRNLGLSVVSKKQQHEWSMVHFEA